MNKTLTVARYEYLRHVGHKRFWISLVSVPLGFVLLIIVSTLLSVVSFDSRPVGIVDHASLIQLEPDKPAKTNVFDPQVFLQIYPNEAQAQSAASAGEIQGFAVVPENYLTSYHLTYWTNKQPESSVQSLITEFIHKNILAAEKIDPAVLARISAGSRVSLQSLDGSQTSDGTGWHRIIVPTVIGMLNMFLVMSSGGYLLQALVEEKENRTIEMLLTSVPPREIMTGKILGNLSVGLTQIAVWGVLLLTIGIAFRQKISFQADIQLSGSYLMICISLMILSFVAAAAMMAIIGSMMTSFQESQAIVSIMIVSMLLPFYFIASFLNSPNGILARVLSFLPLSAPLALSLRMAFGDVAPVEIVLIFLLLLAATLFMFWLAGAAFKRGMLRYNKRLSLKELFRKEADHA